MRESVGHGDGTSITLHLFGRLRDLAGAATVRVPVVRRDGSHLTAARLRSLAADHIPQIAAALDGSTVRIAINREIVADEQGRIIQPTDEVALLPPLSGG